VRGALKIPAFLVGCDPNGDIFGRATDFLEPRTAKHSASNHALEVQIQPNRILLLRSGAFL
jgi:hypothetical protein